MKPCLDTKKANPSMASLSLVCSDNVVSYQVIWTQMDIIVKEAVQVDMVAKSL